MGHSARSRPQHFRLRDPGSEALKADIQIVFEGNRDRIIEAQQ
jgi:hypothetical protein